MKKLGEIQDYEELVDYLRKWRSSFESSHEEYDFAGMVFLLGACLDNLRSFALEAELEDIGGYLDDDQSAFLTRISQLITGERGKMGNTAP
jgi:hypothetical protein